MNGADRATLLLALEKPETELGIQSIRELRGKLARHFEADSDAEEWQHIAMYLADCHAATAFYDGRLKSISKSRRQRFVSICELAAKMLTHGVYMGKSSYRGGFGSQAMVAIVERCEAAVKELGGP